MKSEEKNTYKDLVTLRERKLGSGSTSLILDYTVDGKRIRENLGLYLVPENSRIARMQNAETMKVAMAIKAQRAAEIAAGKVSLRNREGERILISEWMKKRSEAYVKRGSADYGQTVLSAMAYVLNYAGDVRIGRIDKNYLLGFIEFLNESDLGEGTIYTYFQCLMIMLNSAVRAGLIQENPSKYLEASQKPKQKESTREYLTLDEVRQLAATDCEDPVLKRAFLFACLTGLRISDIRALDWSRIHGDRIEMKTQKTGAVIYNPISAQAMEYMGSWKESGPVFPDLPVSPTLERRLSIWAKKAGLHKHVTFHVSRHTNATLLLTYGADIYTVSSVLGHRNVKTTQIYAKIIDKKKEEAVNRIPEI